MSVVRATASGQVSFGADAAARTRLPAGAPAARRPYNRRPRATWCLHSSSSMGGELEGIPFGSLGGPCL